MHVYLPTPLLYAVPQFGFSPLSSNVNESAGRVDMVVVLFIEGALTSDIEVTIQTSPITAEG